jgi:hypothetical protein
MAQSMSGSNVTVYDPWTNTARVVTVQQLTDGSWGAQFGAAPDGTRAIAQSDIIIGSVVAVAPPP